MYAWFANGPDGSPRRAVVARAASEGTILARAAACHAPNDRLASRVPAEEDVRATNWWRKGEDDDRVDRVVKRVILAPTESSEA